MIYSIAISTALRLRGLDSSCACPVEGSFWSAADGQTSDMLQEAERGSDLRRKTKRFVYC